MSKTWFFIIIGFKLPSDLYFMYMKCSISPYIQVILRSLKLNICYRIHVQPFKSLVLLKVDLQCTMYVYIFDDIKVIHLNLELCEVEPKYCIQNYISLNVYPLIPLVVWWSRTMLEEIAVTFANQVSSTLHLATKRDVPDVSARGYRSHAPARVISGNK